jgi:hypothetical protein
MTPILSNLLCAAILKRLHQRINRSAGQHLRMVRRRTNG